MTEIPSSAIPVSGPMIPMSLRNVAGVLFNPVAGLREVAETPRFLLALLLAIGVAVFSAWSIAAHIDYAGTVRQQAPPTMSEKQIAQSAAMLARMQRISIPVSALTTSATLAAMALGFYLLFRLLGGQGTYRDTFAVVVHAWLPQSLRMLVMTALVAKRGLVTSYELQTIVKSSAATLFVNPLLRPTLFSALSWIDLFTVWTVASLAVGLGHGSRLPRVKATLLVVGASVVFAAAGTALGAALAGAWR